MGNNYGISIIIPFYKGHDFIIKSVKSIINSIKKTSLLFEIIIVNDSPDENLDYIINKFNNVNLKIINNEKNYGVAKSRNVGKENSKYEYLYFIDQDDWIDKKFFSEVEYFLNESYEVLIFNFNNYKNQNIRKNYNIIFKFLLKYWLNDIRLIKYGNFFRTIGQLVFKKNLIEKFIETESMGSDDFFAFIEIFSKENLKMKYINEPLLYYRIHNENYTKKANFKDSSLECLKKLKLDKNKKEKMKLLMLRRYNNYLIKFISKIINILITI